MTKPMVDQSNERTPSLYEKFLKAVIYDELFLYFAQIGDYRSPFFKEAYEHGAMAFARKKPELIEKLSNEVAQVLMAMSKLDLFQGYVKGYLELEERLRREGKAVFSYQLDPVRQNLLRNARYYRVQYDAKLLAELPTEDIPRELLTTRDGQIVSLRDFVAHAKNPVALEAQELLDHKNRPVTIGLAEFF